MKVCLGATGSGPWASHWRGSRSCQRVVTSHRGNCGPQHGGRVPRAFSTRTQEKQETKRPAVCVVVDPAAKSKYFKTRAITLPLLPKVDKAINKLVSKGIFLPVRRSSGATPIIFILKKNNKIRLCGNYKCTINLVIYDGKHTHYQLRISCSQN